jgi:organic hydroperoxide reductase OsmC/OhrA
MQFEAKLVWERGGQAFTDQKYSRAHEWIFDGGLRVPASSSPLSVALPMSNADNLDPEEALVAAASSCHMLFFLSIAAGSGFVIDRYQDHATGVLGMNAQGKMALTKITLHPEITFSGALQPGPQELEAMHHRAHDQCYIANSLKAEIEIAPQKNLGSSERN